MTSPLGAMVPIPERVGPWHVPSREFDNGALQSYIQDSAPCSRATSRHRLSVAEGRPRATSRAHRLCASEDTMGSASAVQRQPRPSRTRRMHRLASPDLHHYRRPSRRSQTTTTTTTDQIHPRRALALHAPSRPPSKTALPSSVTCATIDSFQERDSDVVVFATARHVSGSWSIPRRLHVLWTRAELGDRETRTAGHVHAPWKRACGGV